MEIFLLAGMLVFGVSGCSPPSFGLATAGEKAVVEETVNKEAETEENVSRVIEEADLANLVTETKEIKEEEELKRQDTTVTLQYQHSMELQYAQGFSVDYYEGGYTVLTTFMDGRRFLVVPEGMPVPDEIPARDGKPASAEVPDIILYRPVSNLYLVASSAMDMFSKLDSLDAISLSGQKESGWYIEEARKAMADGRILYAGKYNQPDYELILSKDCTLAIENRMITHAPEVVEKLESFHIPVMVEYSSYESHPLGRVEWIKFFGALLGKEEAAKHAFEQQANILQKVSADERTDKTVAFFFVTSNNLIQVRQSFDYVPKMIELAGGRYIFEDLGDPESGRSTLNMQVEEFYHGAKDADFLIYNSSIDGGCSTLGELLEKCGSLADFKAVQQGNVWCTTNDMYQQSMSIGYLIEDIHTMLTGNEEKEMRYLFKLR